MNPKYIALGGKPVFYPMKVETQEVTPEHWLREAEDLARQHGHSTVEEMWRALDQGVYGGDTFAANQLRDLRWLIQKAGSQ